MLGRRCPSAIARLVALGVIDPVDRSARRPISHVGKERRKAAAALEPAVAYGDAAPAVEVEVGSVLVRAPLDHVRPRDERGRSTAPVTALAMGAAVCLRSVASSAGVAALPRATDGRAASACTQVVPLSHSKCVTIGAADGNPTAGGPTGNVAGRSTPSTGLPTSTRPLRTPRRTTAAAPLATA